MEAQSPLSTFLALSFSGDEQKQRLVSQSCRSLMEGVLRALVFGEPEDHDQKIGLPRKLLRVVACRSKVRRITGAIGVSFAGSFGKRLYAEFFP